jgi:hypothetical protein
MFTGNPPTMSILSIFFLDFLENSYYCDGRFEENLG